MLLPLITQRRALVLAEALRRRMHGAVARRHLAQLLSIQEPPLLTAAEQAQLLEYAPPFHKWSVFVCVRGVVGKIAGPLQQALREAAHAH